MKRIDKLQNYFGIPLRSNVTTVKAMTDAILASFFHIASSKENNVHTYCEKSSTSWTWTNVPGYYITSTCVSLNMRRRHSSAYHFLPPSKINRKVIHAEKKHTKLVDFNRTFYMLYTWLYFILFIFYLRVIYPKSPKTGTYFG